MERLPPVLSTLEGVDRREFLDAGIDVLKGVTAWQLLQRLAAADEPMEAREEDKKPPLVTSLKNWHNSKEIENLAEQIHDVHVGIDSYRTVSARAPYMRQRPVLFTKARQISWPVPPAIRLAFLKSKYLRSYFRGQEEQYKYYPKRTLSGRVRGDVLQEHLQQDLNIPFVARSEAVQQMLENLDLTLDPFRHRTVPQVLSLLCNEGGFTLGINASTNLAGSKKKGQLRHGLHLFPEIPGESVEYWADGRLQNLLCYRGREVLRQPTQGFQPHVYNTDRSDTVPLCEPDRKLISGGEDAALLTISDLPEKLAGMEREDICDAMFDEQNKTVLVRDHTGAWKSYVYSEVTANCKIRKALFVGNNKPGSTKIMYNTMFW